MSVPNPFSTSNAPHHNLVPKVIGGNGGQPFEVAVDLVDIDTAYIGQIGTTLAPVGDIYLGGTFYWSGGAFSPPLPGGGGVGPTGPAAQVVGGTGITASYSGTTATITNTGVVSIVPGFGISVLPVLGAYQQYRISYTGGGTGSGPPGPTGPTGGNSSGPPTQILYYGSTGITSSSALTYDGSLNAPAIEIGTSSLVKIQSIGGDSSIQSGVADFPGSGNLLKISEIGGTAAVIIDTNQSFVGINKAPTVALDVAGQTILTYGVTGTVYSAGISGSTNAGYTLSPSTTYFIQGWGEGGASNGGAGGAGGFAGITLTTDGSPHGISWTNQYGGTGGGGNALVLYYDGAAIAYIPGGGAGNTGGTGAAAGQPYGLPNTEGGYSSGYPGPAVAMYTSTTPWLYNTLSDTTITGGTFTGGTVYNIAGNAISGMTLSFSPAAPLQVTTIGVGTTYTTYPGTTYTIQSPSLQFVNSVVSSTENGFVLPAGFSPIVDIGVTGVSGSTGTANYSNWPGVTYPNFTGNPTLFGSTGLTGTTGTVTTGTVNITFVSAATYTWFFAGTVNEVSPNAILGITAGTTFNFSVPFLGLTGTTISTGSSITIPAGTDIRVAERVFTNQGITATDQNGVNNGGGGATGGGSSALVSGVPGIPDSLVIGTTFNILAGGGAGSWYIAPTVTGVTGGGSGINPYTNQFNNYGQYGYGGTTGGGGPAFLVIQTATIGASTPALTVNGNEIVNGNKVVNGSDTVNGNKVVNGDETVNGNLVVTGFVNIGPNTLIAVQDTGSTGGVTGHLTIIQQTTPYAVNELPNSILIRPTSGPPQGLEITHQTGKAYTNNCLVGIDGDLNTGGNIVVGTSGPTGINSYLTVGNAPVFTPAPGDIVATHYVYGLDVVATSDVRTKNSITTVDSALDKVMKMRGVFFERNSEPGERRIGVVAQEIEEILPEVVHTDKDGMKSVSYGSIIGLLIEAIKEQQEVISRLT
jgi:hypothetical protein